MTGDGPQPFVEGTAELQQLAGVVVDGGAGPGRGAGAQQGQQRHGRGQGDAAPQRVLQECGVRLQGGREHRLRRDEEDHELGGVPQGPVVTARGELIDVPAQRPGVSLQKPPAPLLVLGAGALDGGGRQVGVHGRLGVYGEVALPGQVDDDVGPGAAGSPLTGGRAH